MTISNWATNRYMIVQHSDPAEISHFRNFSVHSTKIHKKNWFLFLRNVRFNRIAFFSWISWWKFCSTYIHTYHYCRTLYFQGLLLGFILYFILVVSLTKSQLIGIHLDTRCTVLIGCVRYVNGDIFYHVMIFYLFFLAADCIELSCVYSMHFERVALYKNINWYFSDHSIKMALLSLMVKRMVYPMDVASSFLVHHFSWWLFFSVLYTGWYNSDNNTCTRIFFYFNNSII